MVDLLSTGVSGLLAFQRGLATTSQNIANVATEGYSRQRVELAAREPAPYGSGFIGRGVDVTTVQRLFDQFALNQLRASNADLGRLTSYAELAGRVDQILADPEGGISAALQGFFSAWQDVASNPSSTTARQLLLSQAQALADRFRSVAAQFDQLEGDINGRLSIRVEEINSLAGSIAALNKQIETAAASVGGQPPNDLLDERDRLLGRLSELVNVSTVTDQDGSINVFIGNGQTLVLRDFAASLATAVDPLDAGRVDIVYTGTGTRQVITGFIAGGEVGGLLQSRGEVLDAVRRELGLVATALAQAINDQQAAGLDLYGQLGGAMFGLPAPTAIAAIGNTGSATASAAITDVAALTGDDYVLRYDGVSWSASRAGSGEPVAMTGTGTVADPFLIEGLAVTVGAGAAAGDRFSLRGTRDAAASLRVVMTDPRAVAAAAPIAASALAANLGTGTISAGRVVDAADPALFDPVEIRFLTGTTYSINGAGSYAYVPGADIVVNGWQVQLSGVPAAGDAFRIERNAAGTGDNRNALLAAGLQFAGLLAGGASTLGDAVVGVIGRVGTLAGQAETALVSQQVVQSSAREAVLRASGVNLDEEAADLLKWQRAYQAAAQTIAVADTLFQTLLAATQR
jgi:flagellar hook-associated protein 1 FlgK